jgi:hypothetical protein
MSWSNDDPPDLIKLLTTPAPLSDLALSYTDSAPMPTDIRFQGEREFWTRQITAYGLPYKVFWGSVVDVFPLLRDYDLTHNPGEGWMSGVELLSRWETTPQDLTSISSSLPVYLWRKEMTSMERMNEKIPGQWDIAQFQRDPHNWIDVWRKIPPNIWYSVPQWWWCKVEHIEFYEKLEHEKAIRTGKNSDIVNNADVLEVSLDWLSVAEVKEIWSVSNDKLERLVRDKGLPSYGLSREEGIHLISPDTHPVGFWGSYTFGDRLFKLTEVKKFGKSNNLKRKTRRTPKDRDIERIAKLIPKIKKRSRNITDDKLATVIHWALNESRPFFEEEDEYDWLEAHVNRDHFETAHAESWVRQRIREIFKKASGRPRKP